MPHPMQHRWDAALASLTAQGMKEGSARTFIAKFIREFGQERAFDLFEQARKRGAVDVKSYVGGMARRLRDVKGVMSHRDIEAVNSRGARPLQP